MKLLGKREKCPLHGSYFCCGRQERKTVARKPRYQSRNGVTRIPDEHHPRGYREIRSNAAMRQLLLVKVRDQEGRCFYCHRAFQDMREVTPDHRSPRGLGGATRDDHPDNIVACCAECNREKGSRRDYEPKAVTA